MDAARILAIPMTDPESLFSAPAAVKDEYRALVKKWHPDAGGNAVVFDRIAKLYDLAAEKIARGEWHKPGVLDLSTATKAYTVRYQKRHVTETGETYIAKTIVAHALKTDFSDLVHNAEKIIGGFKFASAGMKTEVSRYLPSPRASFEASDRRFMVMQKTEDLILLRDLLAHVGGKLDPKHVAWVVSSLLNLACYFEYAGITHNAIGLDTYYISPEHHSGALLGGWWYAARTGARMTALPARTTRLAPVDVVTKKIADHRTDLALIRATALELLGNPSWLDLEKQVPKALSKWLRYASSGSAVDDYRDWMRVLKESFGPRRFTELKIKASDIYRKET